MISAPAAALPQSVCTTLLHTEFSQPLLDEMLLCSDIRDPQRVNS